MSWLRANSCIGKQPRLAWMRLKGTGVTNVNQVCIPQLVYHSPVDFHVSWLDLATHWESTCVSNVLLRACMVMQVSQSVPDGGSVLVLVKCVQDLLLVHPQVDILKFTTQSNLTHLRANSSYQGYKVYHHSLRVDYVDTGLTNSASPSLPLRAMNLFMLSNAMQ